MRNSRGEKTIRCENCGHKVARVQNVTRSYGKGTNFLVVENVPVVACPRGGASYLTAETLQKIARIKLHRRSLTKRRNVAVAEFA